MDILAILSPPIHGHRYLFIFKFCSSEFYSFSTTDFKHIHLIIYSFIFGASINDTVLF